MSAVEFAPWPSYSEEEASKVSEILLSNKVNYWTGDEGRSFEKEFAEFADCDYAIAVANGTLALELALRAVGVGSGDEVIVTARTFVASASCIVAVGATPVFADIDRDSQNVTAETIAEKLSTRTRAVICVHLAGWPCEMEDIVALCRANELAVIEDCAQACGARYKGRSVGSYGDVAAWSFCQDKIITTGGEGGMVTTNDQRLWSSMWSYKDHGKSWHAVHETESKPGFKWLHESFGSNFRLTEMQSAIGRLQLTRMPDWHDTRLDYASRIWTFARSVAGLRVPALPEHIQHGAYKCYVFVELDRLKEGWDRDRIMVEVVAEGVPCFSGSCSEVYREKAFDETEFQVKERLAVSKELGDTALMFLVHPTLTSSAIEESCRVLASVMARAVG